MSGKILRRQIIHNIVIDYIPIDDIVSMILDMSYPLILQSDEITENTFIRDIVCNYDEFEWIKKWHVNTMMKKINMDVIRKDILLLVSYNYTFNPSYRGDCFCDGIFSKPYKGNVYDVQFYLPNDFKINKKFEPLTLNDNKIISRYIKPYTFNRCSRFCGTEGNVFKTDFVIVPSKPNQIVYFDDNNVHNDDYNHDDFLNLVKLSSKNLYTTLSMYHTDGDYDGRKDIMLALTYRFKLYYHDDTCAKPKNMRTYSGTVNGITVFVPRNFEINEKFQPLTDDDLQLIQPIVNNMTFTYSCACTIKKPNYILLDKWKIVPVNSLVKVRFF